MTSSSKHFQAYSDQINVILNTFQKTQAQILDQVADKIVAAYLDHKRFLVFGSGHSHMIAEEFYARAGGLAFVTPILQNELTLTDHPLKSTLFERTLGLASTYVELYHMEKGDVLMICSNSGRNAMPVELARLAKEMGLIVVAFTNLAQNKVIGSRHPLGKNLDAYADLTIDNGGAFGDAGYDVGEGLMMGSSSTIVGTFMAQALSILVASKIQALGLPLPVFRSSNLDGSDDDNKALFEQYCRMY